MKLRYLGHSAFELALGDGKKIIFDPYEPGSYNGALGYGKIEGKYDLAIVSHDHADHRCEEVLARAGKIVDKAGEVKLDGGITVISIPTFHDDSGGSERGVNLVSIVKAEGIRVVHFGDLGHAVTAEEYPQLMGAEVLLIPVGGFFTIDAETAAAVVESIGPKLVIPMHFKTEKVGFPIAPVDDFTKLSGGFEFAGSSEIELTGETLSGPRRVVILDPAL